MNNIIYRIKTGFLPMLPGVAIVAVIMILAFLLTVTIWASLQHGPI